MTTPRQYLDWCVERAMAYYDAGDKINAVASFISDIRKHDGTEWISSSSLLLPLTMMEVERGREAFLRCLTGWNVR